MTTIAEIEEAVNRLSEDDRAELLLKIAGSLHLRGAMPEPRIFSKEEMDGWVEGWARIRSELGLVADVWVPDRPVVFDVPKDRPILFTARPTLKFSSRSAAVTFKGGSDGNFMN